MRMPQWLCRMIRRNCPPEPDYDDTEIREVAASIAQTEERAAEYERRVLAALGAQADVWRRQHADH
jgi:hypothetical protein